MSVFNKEYIHTNRISSVRKELQDLLRESPTASEVDDKLLIADLEESLKETKGKLSRRTFVAGAGGIAAGTIASFLVKKYDLDKSSNSNSTTIEHKSFANTLNPDSQLGENLANAVDYKWRIAIPYEIAQNTIDVTVRSNGLNISEKLKLKAGEKPDVNIPMFVGPDNKLYCYLYGIPTSDSGIVEVNIGDNNYNIFLKSIVPQVGDRTGLFLLEEEISDLKDSVLFNNIVEILENAEIFLPTEDKFTVWIPQLAFPGKTVISEDRIGIVVSQEQIQQSNFLTSELPYILGKSILPIYFSPDKQNFIKPGILKQIGDFIETYQSQTTVGQLKANGAEFNDEGQIITYPSYLQALQVVSYDSKFTKAGNITLHSNIEDFNDLFAQIYTITANKEYLQKFSDWFDNTNSIQRAFTVPLLQKYTTLLEIMHKGDRRNTAYKNIKEFLSKRRIDSSNSKSNQRSITP